MKNFALIVCLFVSVSPFAQFRHINFSLNNDVSNALEKVIEDYPNQFKNIRGAFINEDEQTTNYACSVNIKGADSSIIIQTGSENDNAFSWKANVFSGDDFDEVKAKFRSYFNQIKGTSVSINGNSINFNAEFEPPDESKNFTSILFTKHPETDALKNLVIDLNMHYLLDSWQISIAVYEHKDYGVDDNAQN